MLKVLPWIADGATEFIDNFIADRKATKGTVKVFEFGSGNSTLYFLSRGCVVRSVEHDEDWSIRVQQIANTFDYHDRLQLSCDLRPYHRSYTNESYDIVMISGRDRMLCMRHIIQSGLANDAILVFDNSERAEYKYLNFVKEMDIKGRDAIHFEQPQVERGSLRLTSKSYARDRVEHRWITTIFAPRGNYTTQGKPFIRPKNTKPANEKNYKALNDLDKKLEKYLPHRDGFFIEAGANDGVKQSNSYYFAKSLGWKGILVEAIPELFQRCVINRPDSQVYHYALVDDVSRQNAEMHFADLMSTVDGALKEDQTSHIEKGLKVQNLTKTWKVVVPTITLTTLLEQHLVISKHKELKIDLFSLDVEGFELNVLKGLDLRRFRPRYILVECRNVEEIDTYLSNHGYCQLEKLSYHDYLFADAL